MVGLPAVLLDHLLTGSPDRGFSSGPGSEDAVTGHHRGASLDGHPR